MPKAYHRFALQSALMFSKILEISVPVSEITLLTYLIKLLET